MQKIFKIAVVLLLVFIIFITVYNVFFKRTTFSQEEWMSNTEERQYIVDDFLEYYKIIGKSREEIIKLLGKPDNSYFKEENNISYYLGVADGFMAVDGSSLVIWFDESDKIAEYEIMYD